MAKRDIQVDDRRKSQLSTFIVAVAVVGACMILGGIAAVRPAFVLASTFVASAVWVVLVGVRSTELPLAAVGASALVLAPTADWPFNPIAAMAGAAMAGAAAAIIAGSRSAVVTGVLRGVAILLAIPVISSLAHWHGIEAILFAWMPLIVLGGATMAWLWASTGESRAVDRVVEWTLWVSVAVSGLAVSQWVGGDWGFMDDFIAAGRATSEDFGGRPAAMFGHPIILGVFAQTMAITALVIRPAMWQLFYFANLLSVILSGTRSAWIGVVVLSALAFTLRNRGLAKGRGSMKRVLGAMAVALVLSLLVAPGIFDPLVSSVNDRVAGPQAAVGVEARSERIRIGLEQISESGGPAYGADPWVMLFGFGPGAAHDFWQTASPIDDGGARTFDNTYLTTLFDFGVFGLGVLLGLAGVLMARLSWTGRLLLVGLLWGAWSYDVFSWPVPLVLVGLAAGLGSIHSPKPKRVALQVKES